MNKEGIIKYSNQIMATYKGSFYLEEGGLYFSAGIFFSMSMNVLRTLFFFVIQVDMTMNKYLYEIIL